MSTWLNKIIDKLSEFLASRKGLLPLLGLVLILINLCLQVFPASWIRDSNLFLHLGIMLAIIGLMFAWAL